MSTVFLLANVEPHDYCTHERVYQTREMAERNLLGMLAADYAKFLKAFASRITVQVPGRDISPPSFDDWAANEKGWQIEELEYIGLPT